MYLKLAIKLAIFIKNNSIGNPARNMQWLVLIFSMSLAAGCQFGRLAIFYHIKLTNVNRHSNIFVLISPQLGFNLF